MRWLTIGFGCVVICSAASVSNAVTPAVWNLHLTQQMTWASANATVGWSFRPGCPIRAVELEFYDAGRNGLANSHRVGIWDSGGNLLREAVIRGGSNLEPMQSTTLGRWRASIPTTSSDLWIGMLRTFSTAETAVPLPSIRSGMSRVPTSRVTWDSEHRSMPMEHGSIWGRSGADSVARGASTTHSRSWVRRRLVLGESTQLFYIVAAKCVYSRASAGRAVMHMRSTIKPRSSVWRK